MAFNYIVAPPQEDPKNWVFIDVDNYVQNQKNRVKYDIIKEYSKELGIDENIAILAFNEKDKTTSFFEKVIDQQVWLNYKDAERIRELIIDWYASNKTQLSKIKHSKDIDLITDDELNEYLLSFGFPYPHYVTNKSSKIELLHSLRTIYSKKGTPEALAKTLEIYGLRRAVISEWWLKFDSTRTDEEYYAKSVVLYPEEYRNSNLYTSELKYTDFIKDNPSWQISLSELDSLYKNKKNQISLPSITSCFSIDTYNDINNLKVVCSVLQRKVQESYRYWLSYILHNHNDLNNGVHEVPIYYAQVVDKVPEIDIDNPQDFICIVSPNPISSEFIGHERSIAKYTTLSLLPPTISTDTWLFDFNDYEDFGLSLANDKITKSLIDTSSSYNCYLYQYYNSNYISPIANDEYTIKFNAIVNSGSFSISFNGNDVGEIQESGYYSFDCTCGTEDTSGFYVTLNDDFVGSIWNFSLTNNKDVDRYWTFFTPSQNNMVLVNTLSPIVPGKILLYDIYGNNGKPGWKILNATKNTIYNDCVDQHGELCSIVFNGSDYYKFPKDISGNNAVIDSDYIKNLKDRDLFRSVTLNSFNGIYSPMEIMLAISYIFSLGTSNLAVSDYDHPNSSHYFYNGVESPFNIFYDDNILNETNDRTDYDRYVFDKSISYSDIQSEYFSYIQNPDLDVTTLVRDPNPFRHYNDDYRNTYYKTMDISSYEDGTVKIIDDTTSTVALHNRNLINFTSAFSKPNNYDQYNNLYPQMGESSKYLLKMINPEFSNELDKKIAEDNNYLKTLENIMVDLEDYTIQKMELESDMFAYLQSGGLYISTYLYDIIEFLKPIRAKLLKYSAKITQNNALEDSLLFNDHVNLNKVDILVIDKPFPRDVLRSRLYDPRYNVSILDRGIDTYDMVLVKRYNGDDALVDMDGNVIVDPTDETYTWDPFSDSVFMSTYPDAINPSTTIGD